MNLLREVAEKVNRPFDIKLAETKEIIAHHFDEFGDKVSVAFSGGKDSEIVLYLCLQVNPNVPVVFNNTGVEYPQTIDFVAKLVDEWKLNLTVTHPEKSFWDCIEQWGFPKGKTVRRGKDREHCCYFLKEKPMSKVLKSEGYLGYFTGESAIENRNRMFWARDRGMCLHLKAQNVCKVKPILWWTSDEVWQFIRDNNLPINEAYKLGAERVGCMPCTAHKFWEVQLRKVNPKMYEIIKLRKDNQYVMKLEGYDE